MVILWFYIILGFRLFRVILGVRVSLLGLYYSLFYLCFRVILWFLLFFRVIF